jgi:DNA-directed RNA polymerase I, II, and III subunit RPABC2
MSDEEYYSDSDELSETNSEEGEPISLPPNKQSNTKYNEDVGEEEEEDIDDADLDIEEEEDIGDEPDEENIILESDDDEEDEPFDDDEEESGEVVVITKKKAPEKKPKKKQLMVIDEDDEDNDEEYNDNYLEKFDTALVKNYIDEFHPECLSHNYDEITKLSVVVKNSDGIIIDPFHRTIPYLTKYERARILGQRSKQIETGSKPFVKVPENIVDGYIIAELELKEKKIPFIIKRPIPGGGCEYWNLKDLEVIAF